MKVISVLSRKGGSGKTTVAVHLAVARARDSDLVAIVDADPQRSAAKWGERRRAHSEVPAVISEPEDWMGELDQWRTLGADWVILDTPPHTPLQARLVARHTDLILIPCRPSMFDLEAILDTVDQAGENCWVVLNAVSSARDANAAAEALTQLGVQLAPPRLKDLVGMHRLLPTGQTATESKGPAAQQVWDLYEWVKKQVGE